MEASTCLLFNDWVMFMIPVVRSHEAYLQFVVTQLHVEYHNPASKELLQKFFADLIFWVTSIDLSQTAFLLKDRYSSKTKGRKPRDPTEFASQYSLDDEAWDEFCPIHFLTRLEFTL